MAHIILRPKAGDSGAMQLIINGHDFSMETYPDVELISSSGDPDDRYAEVGFRVTFAVSRLDLGGDEDITVTDRLPEVAQLVRSMVEDDGKESP